jgi:hypothetical protein
MTQCDCRTGPYHRQGRSQMWPKDRGQPASWGRRSRLISGDRAFLARAGPVEGAKLNAGQNAVVIRSLDWTETTPSDDTHGSFESRSFHFYREVDHGVEIDSTDASAIQWLYTKKK